MFIAIYYLFRNKIKRWKCYFTVMLLQGSVFTSAAAPDRMLLKHVSEWMFNPGPFIRLYPPDRWCVNSAAVSGSHPSALVCWQWLGTQPVPPGRGSADGSAQPPEEQAHSGGARLQVRTHAPPEQEEDHFTFIQTTKVKLSVSVPETWWSNLIGCYMHMFIHLHHQL